VLIERRLKANRLTDEATFDASSYPNQTTPSTTCTCWILMSVVFMCCFSYDGRYDLIDQHDSVLDTSDRPENAVVLLSIQ
jgi:hypothetical protein